LQFGIIIHFLAAATNTTVYETLYQIRKYTAKFYFKEIPNEVLLQGDTESGFYCKQI
jgi:hypothetical protein